MKCKFNRLFMSGTFVLCLSGATLAYQGSPLLEGRPTNMATPTPPQEQVAASKTASTASEQSNDNHTWVDLGLPSGVKWATCNIGAEAPEEYGYVFAWGDVMPMEEFTWEEYLYSFGSTMGSEGDCGTEKDPLREYVYPNRTSIAGTQFDAARHHWGKDWRMPTINELYELNTMCKQEHVWDEEYGTSSGVIYTGPNGNTIFIPESNNIGEYWSATPGYVNNSPAEAGVLTTWSGTWDTGSRNRLCAIRPVFCGDTEESGEGNGEEGDEDRGEDPSNSRMVCYETWFDNNYAERAVTLSSDDSISLNIDLRGMAQGLHIFNFRPVGNNNALGAVMRKMFYYAPELAIASSEMTSYEMWFDNDYTSRTTQRGDSAIVLTLDLHSMAPGLHTFNLRPTGKGEALGSVTRKMFYYAPELAIASGDMVQYETWFDNEYATRTITQSSDSIVHLELDMQGIKSGLHIFNFRPVGKGQALGAVTRKIFYLAPVDQMYASTCEYWIDDEEPDTAEVYGQSLDLCIDISALSQTTHTFKIRVMGSDGSWSPVHTETFEVGGSALDATEFMYLAALAKELGSMGWAVPWNLAGGAAAVAQFEGVTMKDGHVIAFDFSGKKLTSTANSMIPMTMLAFPELRRIDLSNNNLGGAADMLFAGIAKEHPEMVAKLVSLNLSHNRFSGNLGMLTAGLPSLTTLDVSYNGFGDVVPAVPANVKTLKYGNQTIDRVVPIDFPELRDLVQNLNSIDFSDLNNPALMAMKDKVPPTITFYNHAIRKWMPANAYLFTKADPATFRLDETEEWAAAVGWNSYDYSLCFPYVSKDYYIYKGENGDTLNAIVMCPNPLNPSSYLIEGTNFKVKLTFKDGDVNFDGDANVLDLQSVINFIFDIYNDRYENGEFKPFNFTAANQQRKDDRIDVKDAVLMVNLLLSQNVAQQARYAKGAKAASMSKMAYNANGELIISSAKPVAAFEMSIEGYDDIAVARALNKYGFTYETYRHDNGITRVVAYSLDGATLPAGITSIGEIGKNKVVSVLLSDSQANAITEPAQPNDINRIEDNSKQISIGCDGHNLLVKSPTKLTQVTWAVYSVEGVLLGQGTTSQLPAGTSQIACGSLPDGVNLIVLKAANVPAQRRKLLIDNNK